jgi:hypothetical protein
MGRSTYIPPGQGESIVRALHDLGHKWGLGRPLGPAELGRAMSLCPSDPGILVRHWRDERKPVPGPVWTCMEMFLAGALPPDGLDKCLKKGRKRRG